MSYTFDPSIWGPHYWFFLHTLCISYPKKANAVTKKKYYDFIQNLPLFIPHEDIGNLFSKLLDKYPVSPYLESRESFMKWVHYIHNVINKQLGKNAITYEEFVDSYYSLYKPRDLVNKSKYNFQKNLTYLVLIISLIFIGISLYKL